ncbi:MAG TPA: SAM-dependent methyltransferase [Terriglobia bacterium]|nr:SAM-dependent methyltransferase [Terriglobia bacterium]
MTPLHTYLLETLRRSGPMTFCRYMQLCLYHPEFGYYMQSCERTGIEGDYFTSADLHPIFARLVARQAAEMWELLGRPPKFTWVEMGAGRGLMAIEFLRFAAKVLPDFFAALDYVAMEPSPQGRERVLARARQENVPLRTSGSLEDLEPVTGCFFSNELVDAFPVSVVTREGGKLKEVYVTAEGETLREKLGPISDSAVAAAVARYANQLDEGQRVEVSTAATQWIPSVAEKLARGFVVTIDYGDLAERLYTPSRPRGTLLSYRRHRASEDFFSAPGEQDLTAHVNFSALIDVGRETDLEFTGLTTQEKFLMALGEENQFGDLYDPGQSEVEQLDARLKLKRLLFPGDPDGPAGMGAIFKVLIQHRGLNDPRLTGMKFEG